MACWRSGRPEVAQISALQFFAQLKIAGLALRSQHHGEEFAASMLARELCSAKLDEWLRRIPTPNKQVNPWFVKWED
jgi:hypothetical protein